MPATGDMKVACMVMMSSGERVLDSDLERTVAQIDSER